MAFEDWSQINSGYLANSTIELDCVNQKWIVTIAGLNFSGARCVVWQGEKPFGQDCFHEKGTGIYDKTFGPNGGPSSISIIAPLEIIITPTTLPIAYVGVPYSQFMSQTGPAMGSWLLKNYPMSNCNIPETVVFSIDASTGEITGTPSALAIWTVTIIYQGSDAPFDIEICKSNTGSAIVNGNWCPLQTTIRICPLVTITPASGSLPDAYVGVPYTQSFTSSYNAGSASNNWVLTGTIPPWATYTHNNSGSIASGSMTGTPLTTGVYSFVYEHSFSSGGCPTPSTPYTLNVLCPSITITPSTGSLATGTAGVLQTWLFTISGSSVAGTFTLNSGSLPSGVRIVSDHLTGTPTTSGSYSFELLYSFDSCTPITLYDYTIDIL